MVPKYTEYFLVQRIAKHNRLETLCPGGIYSWWHSASSANGSRSHDSVLVTWAFGILCPALVVIYSWWHSASPANGSKSHDCAPVVWAYGIPCPAMVSPNASQAIGGQTVVPGWSPYMVPESGFRPAHPCQSSCSLNFTVTSFGITHVSL